ncbi:MAG: hypothetical protein AAF636_25380 [Pseudomonadota bacterium]
MALYSLAPAILWIVPLSGDLAFAQTLEGALENPDPGFNDRFGYSVDVSGRTAIIGERNNDTNGQSNSGAAYIFTPGGTRIDLEGPTPVDGNDRNDRFGTSVAISGNRAIVGETGEDSAGDNSGAAHIFDVLTGSLLTTLTSARPAASGNFGSSVAVSDQYAVVGAAGDDSSVNASGAAYVYNVNTGALVSTLAGTNPSNGDFFGQSVAVSGDRVVVGANGQTGGGAVYVFQASTGNLLETLNNPTPSVLDNFGTSVSIDGNAVIVGSPDDDNANGIDAGTAYVYDLTQSSGQQLIYTLSNPSGTGFDYFGSSVDVAGNTAVVGAPLDSNPTAGFTTAFAGTVYAYDLTSGALVQTLNNPEPFLFDGFGNSVAISENEDFYLIGASASNDGNWNSGSAYLYSSGIRSVPEVSATGALAAFASLFAMMAFLWERRRTVLLAEV